MDKMVSMNKIPMLWVKIKTDQGPRIKTQLWVEGRTL